MRLSELLESAHVINDDKARRVLNTAPDKNAGITLKELESGVTIEQLESLTVPVYQYSTQITIHGTFDNMPNDLRVCGYKSLITNQNKSLGVKYVAIDGLKKHLLAAVSQFRKEGHDRWGIIIDSQGCQAQRIFHSQDAANDRQRAIDCYKSTPDSLYVGGKEAGALTYGGYAVILHIGAIYERHLWSLIKALTGIESQAEYNQLKAERDIRWERENTENKAKRKAELERTAIELQTVKSQFIPPSNWIKFTGEITKPGTYAHIADTYNNGIALQVIKTAKRGAYLCDTIRNFSDFKYVDWQPKHMTAGTRKIDGWQIQDKPVKTATVTATVTTDKPLITRNDKLNGIEIRFQAKPDDTILNILRDLGFRWSYKSMLWYSRYTPELFNKVQAQIN